MDSLTLESLKGDKRFLVIAFTEDDLEPGRPLDPSAYQHIHLGGEDYFPEVEELGHEHLIFTTAPYQLTVKDLDSIVDAVPSLDRENETVRVLQITPGIIKQLRNNSSDSYSFNMSHPLPEVVVLLGGKDRLDRYVKENIKFLDEGI